MHAVATRWRRRQVRLCRRVGVHEKLRVAGFSIAHYCMRYLAGAKAGWFIAINGHKTIQALMVYVLTVIYPVIYHRTAIFCDSDIPNKWRLWKTITSLLQLSACSLNVSNFITPSEHLPRCMQHHQHVLNICQVILASLTPGRIWTVSCGQNFSARVVVASAKLETVLTDLPGVRGEWV